LAHQSLYELRSKEKRTEIGISRFACQRALVDFCPRLLMERELTRKETEQQLFEALKNLDKYREYFHNLLSVVKSTMRLHGIVLNIFKSQLDKIPEVKARYFAETPKAISIWLFVEEDNWEVEENIYEKYGEMLDFFPEAEIDLRLLKLFGRKPEELLPSGFKPW